MAADLKRPTRRSRHLMRMLRKNKHGNVQAAIVNALADDINKRGRSRQGALPAMTPGAHGHWRPLTHKAKVLVRRLRQAKVWAVQRAILRELMHEIERGRRKIDKIRQSQAARQARDAAKRTARGFRVVIWQTGSVTGRAARTTPGATRAMGKRAQIRVARVWAHAAHPRQTARLARNALRGKRDERAQRRFEAAKQRQDFIKGRSGPGGQQLSPAARTRAGNGTRAGNSTRKPATPAARSGNGTRSAPARSRKTVTTAQIPSNGVPPLPAERIRPARTARPRTVTRTTRSKLACNPR